MDARAKVLGFERLGDVVICAVFQGLQAALDSGLGGQQDNRNEIQLLVLFDKLRQFQTIYFGHHQIGHYQVDLLGANHSLGFFTVSGGLHVVVFAQDVRQEVSHVLAVIDYEDCALLLLLLLLELLHLILECRFDGRDSGVVIGDELHLGAKMLFAGMQKNGDRRAFAHFALHVNVAVVQVHQFFGQIHSDTCAGDIIAVQLIVAGEALEEHVAFVERYSHTLVLHGQRDESRFVGDDDADGFTGRSELEGVTQQVPEDGVHTSAINPNGRVFRLIHNLKPDMLVVRLFAEIRAGLFHQVAQQGLLDLQFHLLVLHLAELQQLIHHA